MLSSIGALYAPYPVNAPAAVTNTNFALSRAFDRAQEVPAFTLLTVQARKLFSEVSRVLAVIDDKNDRRSCRLGCRVKLWSEHSITLPTCTVRDLGGSMHRRCRGRRLMPQAYVLVLEYEHVIENADSRLRGGGKP